MENSTDYKLPETQDISAVMTGYNHATVVHSDNKHHEFAPSSLDRLEACNGSYLLSKGIEEQESKDSEDGTKLHEAMERAATSGDLLGLEFEEQQQIEKGLGLLEKLKEAYKVVEFFYEQRLQLLDGDGSVLTEGTADVIGICEDPDVVIVLDWKFGRGSQKYFRQGMAYGLGAMQKYQAKKAIVIIAKVRLFETPVFEVFPEDLKEIKAIIENAKNPSEIRLNSGDHCTYCKALQGNCPLQVNNHAVMEFKPKTLLDKTDEQIVSLHEKSKVVSKYVKMIDNEFKKRIEANGGCAGYGFKVKKGNREVVDVDGLFEACKDYVTPQEFLSTAKVSISKIEALVAGKISATKDFKKSEAKEVFKVMSAPFVELGKSKKTIEEVVV